MFQYGSHYLRADVFIWVYKKFSHQKIIYLFRWYFFGMSATKIPENMFDMFFKLKTETRKLPEPENLVVAY